MPDGVLLYEATVPAARPWLPWLAAGVVLGAMAPGALQVAWGWTLAPLTVAGCFALPFIALAAVCASRWPWAARSLALLAAAALGQGLAGTAATRPEDSGPRLLAVSGEVTAIFRPRSQSNNSSTHRHTYSQLLRLDPDAVEQPVDFPPPGRLFVSAPALPAIACGDRIVVRGIWQDDTRGASLQASEMERLTRREDSARGWAWRALERLDIRRELGESLLIGQGTPPEKEDFRRSGLLHILAVSGSHLAIAAALGAWVLRLMGLHWGLRQVALGLLIGGYTWLTGANPATLRALTMGLAVLAMGLMAREPHRLAAVALAAVALVAIDPGNARDLGFLLSLCAVVGIVTLGVDLMHLRERWLPLRPWPLDRPPWQVLLFSGRCALDGLAIGVGASLATAPLIAWTFGSANPWSPLTTLLATPPTTAALWLGLPLMGLAGIWPHGPWDGLYAGLECSLESLASTVRWSAHLPGATLTIGAPHWWILLSWPLFFLPLRSVWGLGWRAGLFVLLLAAW